jgi:CubicO group peptidase (beta-lactamase class C family)
MRSSRTSRGLRMLISLSALASIGGQAPAEKPRDTKPVPDPAWLRAYLEEERSKIRIPALAVSVVVDGEVIAASAVGVRKWGAPGRVGRSDAFHLGSDVKPMTATLAGLLVDEGVLRWDLTVDEMFPALRETTRPEYRKVTVVQLLSHMSGMPYEPRTSEEDTDGRAETVEGRRYEYVRAALEDPPEAPPGTKFIYGGGPILVASYIERRLRVPYERLMAQRIFRPLGMSTAGFGPMCAQNTVNGPWEHVRDGNTIKPIPPDPAQRSQARSPVGRNGHCSVIDFGKFAALHLKGARGTSRFLKPETFKTLHTPVLQSNYALGWGRHKASWHRGLSLAHDGSNGRNMCSVTIVPDENYAICVMTNIGGDDASALCARVTEHLAGEIRKGRLFRPLDQ